MFQCFNTYSTLRGSGNICLYKKEIIKSVRFAGLKQIPSSFFGSPERISQCVTNSGSFRLLPKKKKFLVAQKKKTIRFYVSSKIYACDFFFWCVIKFYIIL